MKKGVANTKKMKTTAKELNAIKEATRKFERRRTLKNG
jgi:hypothetical protein